MSSPAPPIALTIAGSDCCAGAGIQADLKTCASLGVHCLTVVTAVVAETPAEVTAIEPVSPALVQEQLRLLLASYPVGAIKTGMLFSKPHIVAVAEILAGHDIPLVVDPVMVASTGDALLKEDAIAAYRDRLLPLATIVTPNVPEAETLLGLPQDSGRPVEALATDLSAKLSSPVLVKGGHRKSEPMARDVLAHAGTLEAFENPWIDCPSAHGTGCTLSAALAGGLAGGLPLAEAVAGAVDYVRSTLERHYVIPGKTPLSALNQLPVHSASPHGGCKSPSAP